MKLKSIPCVLLASLLLSASGVAFAQGAATPGPAAEARVIVKYKASSTVVKALFASTELTVPRHAQTLAARTGLNLSDGRAVDARTQVIHAQGLSSEQLAAQLAKDSEVEYAVVDQRRYLAGAPNDPRYAAGQTTITPKLGQWYLRAPTLTEVSAINAEGAWTSATGAGVVVAVLDTGVRFDHPDLLTKLYPGYDFVSTAAVGNDGNGMDSDASDPGDWVSSAESALVGGPFAGCTVGDSSWHGTQTAGLIGAAANNGVGMAGVGGDVMILPLRVLGKCGGYDSDIIAAMRWAVGLSVPGVPSNTHPAKVLNLSFGSAGACDVGSGALYPPAIAEVTSAGAVVVASAGNDGQAVNTPANCSGVIAVASVGHTGAKANYSSLGSEVALSAPGGDGDCINSSGACSYPILTTTNAGLTVPTSSIYSDGYNASVGTSFSAPMVAGAAALMFSVQPNLTPAQAVSALKSSARLFPTGVSACQAPGATAQGACACTKTTCGAGLLDASAAVAAVAVSTNKLVPVISYTAGSATPGSAFTLDSSRSVVPSGRTVQQYAWSIVSGASTTRITSATNASTAIVLGSVADAVVIRLTLTDDLGNVATRDVTVSIGGATTTTVSSQGGNSSSSGGGGGALGIPWLLGLALGILALLAERIRRLGAESVGVLVARRRVLRD